MTVLIFGSNSRHKQTKLLEKDATLTLDTTLYIARTEEVRSNKIKGNAANNILDVHVPIITKIIKSRTLVPWYSVEINEAKRETESRKEIAPYLM